jgi:molybdate transport system regulatory protein
MAERRKTTDPGHALIAPAWHLLGGDGIRLGGDHLELLRQIGKTGSIREAAEACDISYRTAWTRVGELNHLSAEPLVLSVNGGAKGGESQLTEAGRNLVATHERARSLFQAALEQGGIDPGRMDSWVRFLQRISMKTSASNQLCATVRTVTRGAVNADVELVLRGGGVLTAQITLASLDRMALAAGQDAWALVKASWVMLSTGDAEPVVSARNRLKGKVEWIEKGAVNSEVCLALPGGERIVAAVTNVSLKDLSLRKGSTAWALFKASSVILGTLG